ncbi:MAG TPA: hypothetical protein VGI90_03970 [Steroidobacteraceae bacterium]|jgi:hypothetical protein
MHTKLTIRTPEAALAQVLDALEHELVEATDEEILEAARDLGMNPMMKGSAAFLGLHYPQAMQWADFFESEELKTELLRSVNLRAETETAPKPKAQRLKRADPAERKNSIDK